MTGDEARAAAKPVAAAIHRAAPEHREELTALLIAIAMMDGYRRGLNTVRAAVGKTTLELIDAARW